MRFSEESLTSLRESVRAQMSEYRFIHTAEVEKMAVRLGNLYAPDKLDILRAAALLHDITKEYGIDAHAELIERGGESLSALDRLSYKTLHARSAVELIKEKYGDFAYSEVLDAVRYHTTGRADMSVCEMIIYLADYIDDSRRFDDCVKLRNYFWDAHPENMSAEQREEHLLRTLLLSFDMTLTSLLAEGSPISAETVSARNSIILSLKR
ncbi:MAG: bis(5'-nucleosyl)-tetraphosphatase (symmetrical) YqeK [Clostridia bacterium]|nr:bis(5'-nucleosyl)-tetraphosphatase (symmetrical) YqeK [Clostridia bacterium]